MREVAAIEHCGPIDAGSTPGPPDCSFHTFLRDDAFDADALVGLFVNHGKPGSSLIANLFKSPAATFVPCRCAIVRCNERNQVTSLHQ
jgi:hypothetical protein